ncbi:hypothetical protein INT43_008052 [Umbelopsis isabellina]|uniref:MYND-type domain-containing protein n=1 Tax=Mortierella isabellina TaxID=91625 RepID=A0A8H7PD16_MORIS|nr:hypothetical protein INT43_008052 [Umbelopsis isabellina]
MREPNFSFPSQNKAAVCITSALYDRRALDCTAILPLINSLTHLSYLTSTSPRIREILVLDGGLERLVHILKTCQRTDKRSTWKWSLAFQCVVNVGVRGNEQIRTSVVEAEMIPVVMHLLGNFLKTLDQLGSDKNAYASPTSGYHAILESMPSALEKSPFAHDDVLPPASTPARRRTIFRPTASSSFTPSPQSNSTPQPPDIKTFQREEDVLLSLQLLAYLSKYPHLRKTLHSKYDENVFSIVQHFTHRHHPPAIQYWAGVIMRNACRKDETNGGIRQCANMQCGKWERFPREFAKCRRCRKAKYCSKTCQSKAWSDGHRWWCVERHAPSLPTTREDGASQTSAVVTETEPTQPTQPPSIMINQPTAEVSVGEVATPPPSSLAVFDRSLNGASSSSDNAHGLTPDVDQDQRHVMMDVDP